MQIKLVMLEVKRKNGLKKMMVRQRFPLIKGVGNCTIIFSEVNHTVVEQSFFIKKNQFG